MDPNYITGFVDGEGSFSITISPRQFEKVQWEVRPSFSVSQNKESRDVLFKIKDYFKCGTIRPNRKDNTYKYEVRNLRDLDTKIIPHFKRYPLQTLKRKDFEVFILTITIMKEGRHLTEEGFQEIIKNLKTLPKNRKRKYKLETF